MSIKQPELLPPASIPHPEPVPPLHSGDRLSRAEFVRRYDAHPDIKQAELVEGVVYVASPVRHQQHGKPHAHIVAWLGLYVSATTGTDFSDNATIFLDFENAFQPDALLRLEESRGGRSQVTPEDYIVGPPELVVEIAASSAAYDLHDKRRVYARTGVPEYLVFQMYEQRVDWFVLRESGYESLAPDEQGILRSEVFPGLWLQPAAVWTGDLARLLATQQAGLASAHHAAFVAKLGGQAPPSAE